MLEKGKNIMAGSKLTHQEPAIFYHLRQSQPQRIKHYAYAGEGHQGTCPHRGYLKINAEDMKGAGSQRDADDVVDECPEQILPNHVNRLLA